jgi:hypothetical protein
MSTATQEIVRLCEALTAEKRAEVADFARFLLMRAENPDDAWEHRLADPSPLPKLESFLQRSESEGGEAALDLKRL